MFNKDQLDRIEAQQIQILRIVRRLYQEWEEFEDQGISISATGALEMKTVAPGIKSLFTFTEFDGSSGTGNKVKPSGPITFASDNTAVATVDGNTQRPSADGFGVDVDVISVGVGVANITGVDPASQNKVAAGDTLTVTSPVQAIAVSATGVLS